MSESIICVLKNRILIEKYIYLPILMCVGKKRHKGKCSPKKFEVGT